MAATCPKCTERSFTEAGRLAAHLAQDHNVGASEAFRESRRLIGGGAPAPTPRSPSPAPATTTERAAIAQRLGVKPSHPVVTDLLTRAGVETGQEETMAKRKTTTCSKCHKPGHNARSCQQTAEEKKTAAAAAGPKPARKHRKVRAKTAAAIARGALVRISASSEDLVAVAKERASGLVRQKLAEELVWAQAYVDELKRVSAL